MFLAIHSIVSLQNTLVLKCKVSESICLLSPTAVRINTMLPGEADVVLLYYDLKVEAVRFTSVLQSA